MDTMKKMGVSLFMENPETHNIDHVYTSFWIGYDPDFGNYFVDLDPLIVNGVNPEDNA